jgi:hypothetical protein
MVAVFAFPPQKTKIAVFAEIYNRVTADICQDLKGMGEKTSSG